jgi:septin 7
VETRYDAYLEQELRLQRSRIMDNRIHACIYFIPPTGHSLRQLDVEFMRRLGPRVNLIPVIAKSDTLTEEEVREFKQRVYMTIFLLFSTLHMLVILHVLPVYLTLCFNHLCSQILDDISFNRIQIYQPPVYEDDDSETVNEISEITSKIPFAVVGASREITSSDGRKIRGRAYPWGIIEVDNEEHNDFVKLRQMLIRTHLEELKRTTSEVLYETYRTQKLRAMGREQEVFSKEINPAASFEEQRLIHEQRLSKMENDMKLVFQQKVQEKEAKLKQSEEELYARHKEMREALERQRADLEEKKRKLEALVSNLSMNKPGTPEKIRKKGIFK